MSDIQLKNIVKSYDGIHPVIDDFNLNIKDGEFVVLLGPSGCGKSTLLRIIAGLEEIDSGKVYLGEKDITKEEPKDRNIAMVFQNYALYPHMTVYDNISIGLQLRKIPKKEIDDAVANVAKVLNIEELLKRKPRQLSGGQMQRVALARAMIRQPKVFLMDEPLSNLDSKLRIKTREEILRLYQDLGTTTIYVTHDQVEAMTMATRIVIMNQGKIMQKGSPDELYFNPKNRFVASFIGTPQMNLVDLTLNHGHYHFANLQGKVSGEIERIVLGFRPEHVKLLPPQGTNDFTINLVEHLGSEKIITLKKDQVEIKAKTPPHGPWKRMEKCAIEIDDQYFYLFDPITEERI